MSLAAPIPVVVFYTTAIVDGDGRAHFLRDVYGHDRKLLAALRAGRVPGPAVSPTQSDVAIEVALGSSAGGVLPRGVLRSLPLPD